MAPFLLEFARKVVYFLTGSHYLSKIPRPTIVGYRFFTPNC
jgi:hypothetical protein